jgi:serine protease Do
MIRRTLEAVKAATFCISLPCPELGGHPGAVGTGFFVSPDGWFVTAAHVITIQGPQGPIVRDDLDKAMLLKPLKLGYPPEGCDGMEVHCVDAWNDFALLKVDFQKHQKDHWLESRSGFPFINITAKPVEEGEPIYAFGFPLTETQSVDKIDPNIKVYPGVTALGTVFSPRVTSAVVASLVYLQGPITSGGDSIRYVIDKALNYGNSGGPIVRVETGEVFAICSQFQPVLIPQPRFDSPQGPIQLPPVMIPSLYGVVSSLSNGSIVAALREKGVPYVE